MFAGYNYPETITISNNGGANNYWPFVAGEYHRKPRKGEDLTHEERLFWTQDKSEGGNLLYYSKNQIWLLGINYRDASGKFHSSWQGLMMIPRSKWDSWAMSEKALRPHGSTKWILNQELKIEGEQKI